MNEDRLWPLMLKIDDQKILASEKMSILALMMCIEHLPGLLEDEGLSLCTECFKTLDKFAHKFYRSNNKKWRKRYEEVIERCFEESP